MLKVYYDYICRQNSDFLMPGFGLLRSTRVGGDIASKLGVTSFNLGLLQHGSLENHFTFHTNFNCCPIGFLFAILRIWCAQHK